MRAGAYPKPSMRDVDDFGYAPARIKQGDWAALPLCASHNALPGLSTGVAILSMPCTAAYLHPEDGGLASFNQLLVGAAKIWYVVPPASMQDFLDWLSQHPGITPDTAPAVSMLKTLLPLLTVDEATKLGIRRIVQQQGDIVVTCPGIAFHWTLSTGISQAESANFLLPAATQAEDAHARAAAEAWLSTPGSQQELQQRVQSLMAKTASWQDLSMHHMFAAAVGLAKAADDGLQCGSLQAAGLDNLASSMAAVWQVLGTLAVAWDWHKVLPPTYPKAVAAAAAAAGEDDGMAE